MALERPSHWNHAAAGLLLILSVACASAPPAVEEIEPPAPVEVPEEYKRTLKWKTASEVDNFGFDVYRGDHEEGPFERLTESPIPGAGTTDLTTNYSYEDSTIDPYREYFYYVESISLQGIREQFTPIIRAKPKLPVSDVEAAEESEPAVEAAADEGEGR